MQLVVVNGKEYLTCESNNIHRMATWLGLRMNVLHQQQGGDMEVLPCFAHDGLPIDNIIEHYYGDQYCCVSQWEYDRYARRFVDNVVNSGASPSEIQKAIDDTRAVKKMFDEKTLASNDGHRYLIMDIDCTKHHVITAYRSYISFMGHTFMIGLSLPTEDETRQAIDRLKHGQSVPCLCGMMPEDVRQLLSEDEQRDFDLHAYDSDGNVFLGPYVIFDSDNYLGHAYRQTKDGKHWYWAGGCHSNYNTLSDDTFESANESELHRKSTDGAFCFWQAFSKPKRYEDVGGMFRL